MRFLSIFRNKTFLVSVLIISLLGNIILGVIWYVHYSESIEVQLKKYPLLSKRILRGTTNEITVSFLPLRQELRKTIAPYQDDFAFYFEYLPTGTSIGINEDSEFTAASLLKVPVAMAYYHKKERLGISGDEVAQVKESELNDSYGDLYKKGSGYDISLEEAVRLSITESDNTANFILADNITDDDFRYVYEGLDIIPALKGNSPIITAVQYTSVLKSLYFSSILTRKDSQHLLDIMTKTKFKDMLTGPIPSDIPVAHKIGLIDKRIYQDCGIVYVPDKPYTLCMISKSDNATAQKRMQEVSKKVYEYVSRVKETKVE